MRTERDHGHSALQPSARSKYSVHDSKYDLCLVLGGGKSPKTETSEACQRRILQHPPSSFYAYLALSVITTVLSYKAIHGC